MVLSLQEKTPHHDRQHHLKEMEKAFYEGIYEAPNNSTSRVYNVAKHIMSEGIWALIGAGISEASGGSALAGSLFYLTSSELLGIYSFCIKQISYSKEEREKLIEAILKNSVQKNVIKKTLGLGTLAIAAKIGTVAIASFAVRRLGYNLTDTCIAINLIPSVLTMTTLLAVFLGMQFGKAIEKASSSKEVTL